MRFVGQAVGAATAEVALRQLRDVTQWTWTGAELTPTSDGCMVRFERPVPVSLRVEVRATDSGIALRLVEGDLTELRGTIDVVEDEAGCRVSATIDLGFRVGVPGTLLRELDQRVLPAWLQAVAQAG